MRTAVWALLPAQALSCLIILIKGAPLNIN